MKDSMPTLAINPTTSIASADWIDHFIPEISRNPILDASPGVQLASTHRNNPLLNGANPPVMGLPTPSPPWGEKCVVDSGRYPASAP